MNRCISPNNRGSIARLALAALAALLLALLAACGGDEEADTTGDDGEADEPAVFTAADAQEAASASLLTLDDLPAGWTSKPADEDDDDDFAPEGLPPECALIFAQGEETDEDTLAEAASDDFVGLTDEEVSSEVSVMKSARLAEFSFELAEDFFDTCSQPMEDAFQTMFEEELAVDQEAGAEPVPVVINDFTFRPQPFKEFGDDTLALEMGFSMQAGFFGFDAKVDIIIVRVGPIVGTLSYAGFLEAPDQALEEELAGLLTERMQAAAAGLGE
jgi:hypothetical protein